jgi:hypothetical protein
MEILKIRTKKGRFFTLSVIEETSSHFVGRDKFDKPVIIPKEWIDSLVPMEEK